LTGEQMYIKQINVTPKVNFAK